MNSNGDFHEVNFVSLMRARSCIVFEEEIDHEINNIIFKQTEMKGTISLKIGTGLLIVLISVFTWTYTQQMEPTVKRLLSIRITATRTDSFNAYCSDKNFSKDNLVDNQILPSITEKRSKHYEQWGLDGSVMTKALIGGNTTKYFQDMNANLFWYMGVFLLPFIVLAGISPFLLSCCVCPDRFPPKLCRKDQSEKYTKCQLMWPGIALIVAIAFTFGCAIYGLMNSSDMDRNMQKFGCALALVSDQPINGGYNLQKTSFFSGFNVLSSDLNDLFTNIGSIRAEFADFIDPAGASLTHFNNLDTLLTSIKKIPDGTGDRGATLGLKYDVPINSATPTVDGLVSPFDSLFGSYDQNDSLMKDFYSSVAIVKQYIESIRRNANNLNTYSAVIDPQIKQMSFTAYLLQTTLTSLTTNFDMIRNNLSPPENLAKILVNFFYGFIICVCATSLIGIIGLLCCNIKKFKYAIYVACVIFFVFGAFSLVAAVLFSFLVPNLNWTCNFLETALQTKSGFLNNFSIFVDAWSLTKLAPCMKFGDGDIISVLTTDSTAADGVRGLSDIIVTFGKFDKVALKDGISKNYTKISRETGYVVNGMTIDLDQKNLDILSAISDQKNSYLSDNCNNRFIKDSWIPSTSKYQTTITCKSQTKYKGDQYSCNPIDGITCKGCMDATLIGGLYTTKTGFNDALDDRYSELCSFNPIMSNIWANYYHKKEQILGKAPNYLINTGPYGRITALYGKLFGTVNADQASKIINDFSTTISTITTNLVAIKPLIDPKEGMLAGLNCKVLGESMDIVKNTICGGIYNDFETLRMTFGITGWSLLISLIFSTLMSYRIKLEGDEPRKVQDQLSNNEDNRQKVKQKNEDVLNVQYIQRDQSFSDKKQKKVAPFDATPSQNRNNSSQIFQEASIRNLKSKR